MDELNEERCKIATVYLQNINNEKILLPRIRPGADSSWHQFVVHTKYRDELLEYLKENKQATVGELARMLFVSETTVRRTLDELQDLGLVERTHGGAVLHGRTGGCGSGGHPGRGEGTVNCCLAYQSLPLGEGGFSNLPQGRANWKRRMRVSPIPISPTFANYVAQIYPHQS